MKISVINGPNLNLLGLREPDIYGKKTYDDLVGLVQNHCDALGIEVVFFQSNHEGALVDAVQQAYFDGVDGIVINPGGYTHTSVAILDALKAVQIPAVEVHISDLGSREPFRQISYIRSYCLATVQGQGFGGYTEAVRLLKEHYDSHI